MKVGWRVLALLAAAGLLFGCSSTKPVAVSPLRQQGQRAEETGREAYGRRSWAAAAGSFGRAAEIFEILDDSAAAAAARHNQGQALHEAGDTDGAVAALQLALALNRRADRANEQAENLAALAQCYQAGGKPDDAIRADEEALKLAKAKLTLATIQNDLALLLLERGHPDDQARVFDLLSAARKAGAPPAVVHLNRGRAELQWGAPERAEENLGKALVEFRALDDPLGLACTHEALGRLYRARHNEARARSHFQQAREKFEFLKDAAALRRLAAE